MDFRPKLSEITVSDQNVLAQYIIDTESPDFSLSSKVIITGNINLSIQELEEKAIKRYQ